MDSFALRQTQRQSPKYGARHSPIGRPPQDRSTGKTSELQPLLSGKRGLSFGRPASGASHSSSSPLLPTNPPAPSTSMEIPSQQFVKDHAFTHGCPRRLNSTQLFDLYRRLDVDSNGELDLVEFLRVAKMLHMDSCNSDADTDRLAQIFNAADTQNNGFLTAGQFSRAYEMILAHKGKPHRQAVVTYVQAIRYGRFRDKYVASIYTGSVDNITTFQSVIPPHSPHEYKGTLAGLVDMVADDARRNATESARQKMMWWIDVSCSEKSVHVTHELCDVFGLTEDSESLFLSTNLCNKDKTRLITGIGVRNGRSIQSLGIAIETMWLKNRPVVDMFPEKLGLFGYFPFRTFHNYITPRLASLYSYRHCSDLERGRVLLTAESTAKAFCPLFYSGKPTGHEGKDHKNKIDYLLSDRDIRKRGAPAYVHDVLVLHLLKYNDASISNCVLSVRQMDDYDECGIEMKSSLKGVFGSMARAQGGVLGRLIACMIAKIVEVMDSAGVSFDGQIADSSAQLLSALTHLIHDYTVSSSLSPVQEWMGALEQELNVTAMPKHDGHTRLIRRQLEDISNYVKPFTHILESHIIQSHAKVIKRKVSHPVRPVNASIGNNARTRSDTASTAGSEVDSLSLSDDSIKSPLTINRNSATNIASMNINRTVNVPREGGVRLVNTAAFTGGRRRSNTDTDYISIPVEPVNAPIDEILTGHPGNIDAILPQIIPSSPNSRDSPFHIRGHHYIKNTSLLREVHECAKESFADLLYGNTILWKKGCVDWLKLVAQFEKQLNDLGARHAKQLEEQRTSYMFVLTIFQVMSWPVTFMTGYWGMNFDNMGELFADSYPIPFFPGYKLMWFAAACVYTLIIAIILHTKLLQGAF